jgi:hypothetical protein
MMSPLIVRPLIEAECQELKACLHSSNAFNLRRYPILLASARSERVPQIAHHLRCDEQPIRNDFIAFNLICSACLSSRTTRKVTPSTD